MITTATNTILGNRKNGFTIPTAKLYPFQWNWDSAFIASGYSYFNLDFAIQEFKTLMKGQWENGMIPHIIFHSENEKTYFPNFDFWKSDVNSGSPKDLATSGISQPPVHGFLLERIYLQHPNNPKLLDFIKWIFPKIVNSHRFFYKYRDPNHEGLFFLYHPWESGRDNSPIWDELLENIELDPSQIPAYTRLDTLHADPSERPTDDQYDRFVYLLELGKKYKYDGQEIAKESPLKVQDSLMNAVLIRSNQSLIRLGKIIGEDVAELEEWNQQSVKLFNQKLWNDKIDCFASYDMVNEKLIGIREIGGWASLCAGIANQEQAEKTTSYLQKLQNNNFLLCPSFDPFHAKFDPKRYWRGPIWPHMNTLLFDGLIHYGFNELANKVKEDTIYLIENKGFYEYFEPRKSISEKLERGYGGNHFSWTASSYLTFKNI